jgi:hypothetical protein
MANIEIQKSDISEFFWLQNAVEEVLCNETLRRAILDGHYPPGQRWLYKEKVEFERYGEDGPKIFVQYEELSPGKFPGKRTFYKSYTIHEVIGLCILWSDILSNYREKTDSNEGGKK